MKPISREQSSKGKGESEKEKRKKINGDGKT